jgi:RNA polymerase sigma-70 factor, ECF subfamily
VTHLASIHHEAVELEAELEQHRRALTAYCYRMLGSAFEADDAVQETMLRAWRGIDGYEARASLRSWLYRIATNVCIDALNGRRRRALPMDLAPSVPGDRDVGAPASEVTWIGPIPDGRVLGPDDDPAEQAATRDSIRLAFVAALQHLRPKPRAVLILRDVVGWPASEVADVLDTTAAAVHSTLQRARRTLAAHNPPTATGMAGLTDADRALLARYVDAFVRYDVDALVALLRDDATMSMPPQREWMAGRQAIERWLRGPGMRCGGNLVLETSANGGPAFALLRRSAPNSYEAHGIQLVEISDGWITGIHTFRDRRLFSVFGLPTTMSRQPVVAPA